MSEDQKAIGWVFDIQRWSLHDGPGVRTNVFLKGCPLRCAWCSNPESQETYPEIAFFQDKCIGCGKCIIDCPYGGVKMETGIHTIDYTVCAPNCYKDQNNKDRYACVRHCYAGAMEQLGKPYTAEEVLEEVFRDQKIYEQSGGGLTVTGGEPLMQVEFLAELFKGAKKKGLPTAMETCAYAPWSSFEKVLEYLDFLFVDIKLLDSEKHKKYTGRGNALILENCVKLDEYCAMHGIQMVVRTPVIPQINDDEREIGAIADFICERLPHVHIYQPLPYHRLGRGKYGNIGKHYELEDIQPPSEEVMERLRNLIAGRGLAVSYE